MYFTVYCENAEVVETLRAREARFRLRPSCALPSDFVNSNRDQEKEPSFNTASQLNLDSGPDWLYLHILDGE